MEIERQIISKITHSLAMSKWLDNRSQSFKDIVIRRQYPDVTSEIESGRDELNALVVAMGALLNWRRSLRAS